MTLFGHCLAAPGTKPDHYHSLCRREYVDQYGVRHVCGCPKHELDDQNALQTRGNDVSAWDNGDEKREPDRANESDSLATVSTTPKGA